MNVLHHSIPSITAHPSLSKNVRTIVDQFGLMLEHISSTVNAFINLNGLVRAAEQVIPFYEAITDYKQLIKNRKLSINSTMGNIKCNFSVNYPGEPMLFKMEYEFQRGEIYALSGKSGSGKSSFFNTLCGINPYATGEIYAPHRENFIYISQSIAFKPGLDFADTILYPARLDNFDKTLQGEIVNSIHELAIKFGISKHAMRTSGKWIENLSGGEVQRLAALQAIIKMMIKCKNKSKEECPHIVLLIDEGLNALDKGFKKIVFNTLKECIKEYGVTAIAIDHSDEKDLQYMYGREFIIDFNKFASKTKKSKELLSF